MDWTERHVGSYFHSLLEKNDAETDKHHSDVDKVPAQAPIAPECLDELKRMFNMAQSELDLLVSERDFQLGVSGNYVPLQLQRLDRRRGIRCSLK